MEMNKQRLEENIRNARKSAIMTQDELALKLGINRATISKYENGEISPSLESVEKIAAGIDVSPLYLLDGVFEVNGDGNA